MEREIRWALFKDGEVQISESYETVIEVWQYAIKNDLVLVIPRNIHEKDKLILQPDCAIFNVEE